MKEFNCSVWENNLMAYDQVNVTASDSDDAIRILKKDGWLKDRAGSTLQVQLKDDTITPVEYYKIHARKVEFLYSDYQ